MMAFSLVALLGIGAVVIGVIVIAAVLMNRGK